MNISVNQIPYSKLRPMFVDRDIIIAIDTSKTNTAIGVQTLEDGVKTIIELNGTASKDVLQLAKDHRRELSKLFEGSNIILVGIEDIITKKNEGIRNTHEIRFMLTHIFCSMLIMFQDTFNIDPIPVNNQAWKNLTIGPELNRRDIYKGSVEYIYNKYPEYRGYSDDATDVLCILEYLIKVNNLTTYSKPNEVEHCDYKHSYTFLTSTTDCSNSGFNEFSYNPDLELKDNISFICNRAKKGTYSYAKVDISKMEVEQLVSVISKKNSYLKMEPYLVLVIYHKEGRG